VPAAKLADLVEYLRGTTVCGGRFTLERPLQGSPEEGVWRGAGAAGGDVLVAFGLSAKREPAELERVLSLPYPGFARLLAAGAVDPPLTGDAVVTDLPAGVPSDEALAACPSGDRPATARTLAGAVGRAVAVAHVDGRAIGEIRPEAVWVPAGRPAELAAVVPQPSALWRLRAPVDAGVVPGYSTTFEAPEVLLGAAPGLPDDVFALAATFWWWATGEHPFGGETRGSQFLGIVAGELRPWPGAPELAAILTASLGPRARRPDVATLAARLQPNAPES
jgi:eukaryotic-like serine/threonine-protein kinase